MSFQRAEPRPRDIAGKKSHVHIVIAFSNTGKSIIQLFQMANVLSPMINKPLTTTKHPFNIERTQFKSKQYRKKEGKLHNVSKHLSIGKSAYTKIHSTEVRLYSYESM
jgi:hypothetical protein